MYSSDESFQRSRECYFGVYFPSCEATREINTKITLEWAQNRFATRVHTLFYFLHEFYTSSRVALARFSFCWWRHNRLLMTSQWPDNCDAITWIVISNSLDIDFIHGDIHGRSCKKCNYLSMQWFCFIFPPHRQTAFNMKPCSYDQRRVTYKSDVVTCRGKFGQMSITKTAHIWNCSE